MKYPINEQVFAEQWINGLDTPDDIDKELGAAIAAAINRAYYAGVEQGRKEAATCRKQS